MLPPHDAVVMEQEEVGRHHRTDNNDVSRTPLLMPIKERKRRRRLVVLLSAYTNTMPRTRPVSQSLVHEEKDTRGDGSTYMRLQVLARRCCTQTERCSPVVAAAESTTTVLTGRVCVRAEPIALTALLIINYKHTD